MTVLSICMATFKRADFIVETLDSIIPQLSDKVELVIVEGASPDNTEQVVRAHVGDHPHILYVREQVNSGADADFDKAVGYARGEYCWLFPDDDILLPGAVARVLAVLEVDPDLLIVDAVVKDAHFKATLQDRRLPFSGERRYGPGDADRLLMDTAKVLSFIGATIIKRHVWLERDRQSYYGSLFIHVGVIFQQPPLQSVIVLGEPLIAIRFGNALWSGQGFAVWALKWPDLIWSFPGYADAIKRRVVERDPWRSAKNLLSFRAKGGFTYHDYKRLFSGRRVGAWRAAMVFIALMPGTLANFLGMIYLRLIGERAPAIYELLHCSPYRNVLSRWIASVGRRAPGSEPLS